MSEFSSIRRMENVEFNQTPQGENNTVKPETQEQMLMFNYGETDSDKDVGLVVERNNNNSENTVPDDKEAKKPSIREHVANLFDPTGSKRATKEVMKKIMKGNAPEITSDDMLAMVGIKRDELPEKTLSKIVKIRNAVIGSILATSPAAAPLVKLQQILSSGLEKINDVILNKLGDNEVNNGEGNTVVLELPEDTNINIDTIIATLQEQGIQNVEVERNAEGKIKIMFPSDDTITYSPNQDNEKTTPTSAPEDMEQVPAPEPKVE